MIISKGTMLTADIALMAFASAAHAQTAGSADEARDPAATAGPSNAEAAQEAAASGVPDIVVTGTALGERRALDAKRQANNLVEALYANDVDKLPEQNVAEAVRRLSGLSVASDQWKLPV